MKDRFTPLSRRMSSKFLPLAVLLLAGCTDDPPTESDAHGPQVRILYPPNQEPRWAAFDTDYVDIYIGAWDDQQVREVNVYHEGFCLGQRDEVGSSNAPIAISEVPQNVREQILLPPDWSLYHIRWRHTACGLERLFATATDPAANLGFADEVTIRATTLDCDMPTLFPDFRVDPSEGSALTEFTFDAVGPDPQNPLSRSIVEFLEDVAARWDFDGDDLWELDWSAGLMATDRPTHRFETAGTYQVSLELREPGTCESRRSTHIVVVGP